MLESFELKYREGFVNQPSKLAPLWSDSLKKLCYEWRHRFLCFPLPFEKINQTALDPWMLLLSIQKSRCGDLPFFHVPEDVLVFSHNLCCGLTYYGSMLSYVTDHIMPLVISFNLKSTHFLKFEVASGTLGV